MTDRIHSFTVILERDIPEDKVHPIIEAIRCLRFVQSVSGNVSDPTAYVAMERARHELGQKLLKIVYPEIER